MLSRPERTTLESFVSQAIGLEQAKRHQPSEQDHADAIALVHHETIRLARLLVGGRSGTLEARLNAFQLKLNFEIGMLINAGCNAKTDRELMADIILEHRLGLKRVSRKEADFRRQIVREHITTLIDCVADPVADKVAFEKEK